MPAFTPGNIVVYRVGTGTGALGSTGTPVFLDEYTPAGVLVQSIPLPTADVGSNQTLTANGSSTAEGLLDLSSDGRYLILTGYDAAVGAATSSATSATVARVIGRVDASGNIDTTTALNTFNTGNIRGATSIDGTSFWATGSNTGVVYATLGATTATVVSSTVTNLRAIDIFDGQLYVSSMSGALRLGTVGTGTPTGTGATTANLPGFPTTGSTNSPYQFVFADLTPAVAGVDTLYVADDRTTANGGGLLKYSLVSGSWVLNGSAAGSLTTGLRGLTGDVSGTTVTFYATTTQSNANSIVRLIDTGGYNAAFSSSTFTTVATAATNTAFRGIDFAPQAAGPTLPTLSISDVSQNEDSGTFTFTLTLSAAAGPGGVTFDIATADGTGTAGSDYTARSLTGQTIAEGQTSYEFTVQVTADSDIEANETFFVNVTNVTGATVADGQGRGTIVNDDTPPTPAATIADALIVEGDSGQQLMVFTVTLSFAPAGPVTIDYATSNGTATAGSDYTTTSGQISFATGQTTQTISVPILGDTVAEVRETYTVTLSNPSGATLADASATGTITDNDGVIYHSLAGGTFSQNWSNTGMIIADDDWSGVPSIIGYRGDGLSDSPGTNPGGITGTSNVVDVNADEPNASLSSGGVGEFEIADPTIGLQGSGTADAPYIVIHLNSIGRDTITVSYRLRDIDGTADNAAQPIALQYRAGDTGPWIDVTSAYIGDATTGPSTLGPDILVSAVLPAGAENQERLQVRIITSDASGSDEWVGIDDIQVTSQLGDPSLRISDASVTEGNSGTTPIVFTVTRFGDPAGEVTADYAVTFGSGSFAADASDFEIGESFAGTIVFASGETVKTITLDVAGDVAPEATETFTVTLSNVGGGTLLDGTATGTIANDDGDPPSLAINDVTQAETNAGTTTFTFTVTRTGGTGPITVQYATADGSATAGQDYSATSGTLSFADGEMSKTIDVSVIGDTAGEPTETFQVQLSNPTGFAIIADGTGLGTIVNDDPIFIHDIQGTAYFSPILAQDGIGTFNTASLTTVIIQAVVTAIDDDGNRQGFYLTEETGHWDLNNLTSEGIFVMTRNDANVGAGVFVSVPGLQVGDLVTVTAQVMEYQAFNTMPRTVLVNSTTVINSSGNELPALVLDAGRPIPNSILTLVTPDYTDSSDGAGDTFDASLYALSFFETVEGMLVTIPDMIVADGFVDTSGGQPFFQAYSTVHADPDQINDRGGYTIAGDPPLSPPDTADSEDGTIAGGRHLHDGDVNPDIIEVDFSGFAIDAPAGLTQSLSMGDRLGDVTGIIEFDFTDRKLFVTDIDPTSFVNEQPAQEVTVLGDDTRSLTVATFNVENLDPGDGAARFAALANAIAVNLNAPDIISIEEIQDNNGSASGTTDASITWQMLVDALNAAVPGASYQWVDQAPVDGLEGGEPGGNIRVGFLYNTNRVQLGDLAPDATIAERRQFTDRIGDGLRDAGDQILFSDDMIAAEINPSDWSSTRLSLLGQFTFHGNTVFVTANHFTAKGGSGQFWQFDQTLEDGDPDNNGWSKRVEQANDVYTMLNHIQANAAGSGIVAGGDFNDFYFYRPLETLTGYVMPDGTARSGGARFDNLTLTLAEAERYTYTFDGRSQAIDHIVANNILSALATYDIVHLNTGYNPLGTGADADPGLSDHDPALASFDFRTMSETLTGTAEKDVFLMHQGGDDTVYGLGGRDIFYFGAAYSNADTVDGGADRDTLILQGVYDITFSASSLISVEAIVLLWSADNRYGGATAGPNSYDLTVPGGLAGGEMLLVDAGGLAANETLIFDGSAETTAPFNVYGGAGGDTLTGGGGHDHLDGGAGIDMMTGGAGNDNYIVTTGDHVFELSGEGVDKVFARSSYVLTFNSYVEVLATVDYRLTTAIDLTGNQHNNAITGNEGTNYLNGGGGDDHIKGLGGDDFLTGGDGRDLLYGGPGNDGYEVDAFDLVFELENEGTVDIVYASSSYALLPGSHVERLQIGNGSGTENFNLSGNEFDNRVSGNNGNNLIRGGGGNDVLFGFSGHDILDGGAGSDSLIGHSGDDIYYVDELDFITETSGNGFDSAYSSTDYTLAAGVHVEVLATRNYLSTDAIDLTGNEFNNSVTGNSGDNELKGMAGHDSLSGGAGDDLIDGGAGRDILAGGLGGDTFRFTSTSHSAPGAGDRITDFVSGTDKIDLSQIDADTNMAGDQQFTFIGTAAFSGTAGELRYDVVGGRMHIYGDVNGDGLVDLHIAVDGTIIAATDFAF